MSLPVFVVYWFLVDACVLSSTVSVECIIFGYHNSLKPLSGRSYLASSMLASVFVTWMDMYLYIFYTLHFTISVPVSLFRL